QRAWQMRGLEHAGAPIALEHLDREVGMKHQLPARTDTIEKLQRLGVASHQHVLAVIDEISGLGVGERISAAAQGWFAFEHGDAKAPVSESNGGAQPGESAADHDDVARLNHCALAPRPQPRAGPGAANQVELAGGRDTMAPAHNAAALARDPLEQRAIN